MSTEPLPRDDVAASVAAMRELGSDYDDAVADALAERLEQTIDARIEQRLQAQGVAPVARTSQTVHRGEDSTVAYRFALAIGSMVLAVPLTAITAGAAGGTAVIAVWIAIALINIVFVLGTRRRDG